jgi:hypothetical protein
MRANARRLGWSSCLTCAPTAEAGMQPSASTSWKASPRETAGERQFVYGKQRRQPALDFAFDELLQTLPDALARLAVEEVAGDHLEGRGASNVSPATSRATVPLRQAIRAVGSSAKPSSESAANWPRTCRDLAAQDAVGGP